MVIGSYISIITLNVNGLNAPMKRHRLTEWIQEQEPYICCLQETHLRPRDTYKLKLRCWEKIFQANRNQKKMGVAIFTTDKIDVKIKTITGDKEGQYIIIKGSIQEENVTIINVYVHKIGELQYIKQMLATTKGEIDHNTIIVGDFNTPLTPMDRTFRKKINEKMKALNDTLDQLDLIDIYRPFHTKQ